MSLQYLLAKSKCARFLAVRQVTQLNTSKRTAGVDHVKLLNPENRVILVEELKSISSWKHSKLRRVYIPKPDGDRRPLGIPTLRDRAAQYLLKYCLEPVYEAQASSGSFGFRPGRSSHDIQKKIFVQLRSSSSGVNKRILKLDIEKCFDKIDQEKLMSLVTLHPSLKKFLGRALREEVLGERIKTLEDTTQGGVISPLLANIALSGIEDIHNELIGEPEEIQNGFRYADDMVFFLKKDDDPDILRNKIDIFLTSRGLKVKRSKTQLVNSTGGFDFLGWTFKVGNKRFRSYPSKDSMANMTSRIKYLMKDSTYTIDERLDMVKVYYKGWFNYNKYCDLSEVNLYAINILTHKYLRSKTKMLTEKVNIECKKIFSDNTRSVNAHIAVKGKKSIYDGDLIYWAKRNNYRFDGPLSRTLKVQKFKCEECNLTLLPNDIIELHHIDGNNENYKVKNLSVLHRSCHHYQKIHSFKSLQKVQPK